MSEQVPVSFKLCNRTYKIRVDATKEAYIRQTIQKIQQTLLQLKQQFPGRDEQDYLAMTLIDSITSIQDPESRLLQEEQHLIETLESLHKMIDE
ncbi:MAG TPA: cell division protein ZapA [Chitinophagaceae bacterium]|nr:cell division protein ZapA [Chitinophagaceae bacterium]